MSMTYIPAGPVHEFTDTEDCSCPWCGSDDQHDDTIGDLCDGNIAECRACRRAFDIIRDEEATPGVVGLITLADVRYIGQQLAKTY